jgi:outer membrane receptor protein involved in Fe transport
MTNRLTKQALYISALLMLGLTLAAAQNTGKISGIILDAQTGDPLIGTNVVLVGTSLGASTDLEGTFFILNIPAGKYDLQVSMVGYEKIIQRGVIVNSGRTTTADFKLKPTTLEQEAVVVEATRPDVEREKTSTSEIVRTEDIKQLAGMHDVSDVLGLASDVADGHFRGGRDGEELYTLHGMGIINPLDNSTGLIPIMSAVEEVEVVTSGFGAQYGNAQSGVVNISMKEGKTDQWHSFVDFHTRLPGRKHFGSSVFDPAGNPYLSTFLNPSTWATESEDPNGGGQYTTYGNAINQRYGSDTLAMIAVARSLWAEMKKNLNRNYWNTMDYSAEFSTGGPINENMRMFIALNNKVTFPFLPTEHPDDQKQILGNLVADVGNGATLRLSGAIGQNKTNVFPSLNSPPQSSPSYYNWLWDEVFGVQSRTVTNGQLGVRFTKSLGKSTFYEIKLSSLITHKLQGSAPYSNYILDTLGASISDMIGYYISSPGDNFNFGKGGQLYQDDKTQTYSLDASFTSQITKNHLLNAGVQSNVYHIDVNDVSSGTTQLYTATPIEASLYAQDKIEFEGMIANVGLRVDIWDENTNYNPNIYSPFRLVSGTDTTTSVYNKSAMNTKVPTVTKLQPRVGLSFPISINTVFHLNYGSFMQRPSFQYVLQQTVNGNFPTTLGNPALKPQTTYSYDVGVMQGLGEGFTLDMSGYYKDVQNLIQAATYRDVNNNEYTTYINSDYADIRGFRVTLNKRKGNFSATLSYHYSVATGKAASPGQYVPKYYENPSIPTGGNALPKDNYLDFDRTHNAILNLSYLTGENWGLKIGNSYPLADVSISSSTFARSGRPYSGYNAAGSIEVFNKRTPAEYNTSMKLSKRFRNVGGTNVVLYVEVLNLFNNQILNYDYLFGTSQNVTNNNNIQIYENNGVDSPNGIRYKNIYNQSKGTAYGIDQSFAIYSNEPRSINIGLSVEF